MVIKGMEIFGVRDIWCQSKKLYNFTLTPITLTPITFYFERIDLIVLHFTAMDRFHIQCMAENKVDADVDTANIRF